MTARVVRTLASLSALVVACIGRGPVLARELDRAAPSPGVAANGSNTAATDSGLVAAVSANNAFGLDLYRRLAAGNASNLFFSPFSVASALGMAALGARGTTAEEIFRVLHRPSATEDPCAGLASLHQAVSVSGDSAAVARTKWEIDSLRTEQRKLIDSRGDEAFDETEGATFEDEYRLVARINELLAGLNPTELEIANALWGEKTAPFRQEYLETVNGCFGTGAVGSADFVHAPEEERLRINDWVAGVTRGRIQELLSAGSVDDSTRLVLTNAIYFKGEWQRPFNPKGTKVEAFHLSNGAEAKARLMQQDTPVTVRYGAFESDGSLFATPEELPLGDERTQRYPRDDGFAMVELPYRGGALSMIVVAPLRPDGLGRIEALLDAQRLSAWVRQLTKRSVQVFLPRFRMDTDYSLNEDLAALGMPLAFQRPGKGNGADFIGMIDAIDPEDSLYISLVQHKAFVEVNEEGTEAAAATAVVMDFLGGLPETEPFIPTFRADRPFFIAIRDRRSGALLFVGRVMRPDGDTSE